MGIWDQFRPGLGDLAPNGRITRWDMPVRRILVPIVLPVLLYFYSPRWAPIVVIPCGLTFIWHAARAWREFTRRGL